MIIKIEKKWIWDKIIVVLFPSVFVLFDHYVGYRAFSVTGYVIVSLIFLGTQWQLNTLPVDMLIGKKTMIAYYEELCPTDALQIFYHYYNVKLVCRDGSNNEKRVYLEYPVAVHGEVYENEISQLPEKHRKTEISYYRLSKVICGWKYID